MSRRPEWGTEMVIDVPRECPKCGSRRIHIEYIDWWDGPFQKMVPGTLECLDCTDRIVRAEERYVSCTYCGGLNVDTVQCYDCGETDAIQ